MIQNYFVRNMLFMKMHVLKKLLLHLKPIILLNLVDFLMLRILLFVIYTK